VSPAASPFRSKHIFGAAMAIAGLAAMTCASSPARAGLGDLMKKAKEKVTQASAPKTAATSPTAAAGGKPVFDDTTIELTSDRLDHILGAFKSAAAAGAGRPALAAKLNQVTTERGKLLEKNEESIIETRRKRDEIEVCCHDGYGEARDKRAMEFKDKALTDPAIREKFSKAAAQYNAAAAQGDSTAIAKLNEILQGEILPTAQDSADVRRKCGPKPAVTAAEAKLVELDKQIATLDEQIRAIDEKVADAQAKQGGLNRRQWAMALERIQLFLSHQSGDAGRGGGRKGKADTGSSSASSSSGSSGSGAVKAGHGFTQDEIDALEKRMSELRTYMG